MSIFAYQCNVNSLFNLIKSTSAQELIDVQKKVLIYSNTFVSFIRLLFYLLINSIILSRFFLNFSLIY